MSISAYERSGSRGWQKSVKWLVGGLCLCLLAGAVGRLVLYPSAIRMLVAVGLITLFLGVSARRPERAMYILVLYLPFMGLVRRWLIPLAGWGSLDPLLIVAPVIISLFGSFWVYARFIRRDSTLVETRLFTMVRWLLLIDCLEAFNPLQGGILAGAGGVMFYVIPILWMVLSKQHLNERRMRVVFATVFFIGILTSLYGLKQTFLGFAPFEQAWIAVAGYTALFVGHSLRAFSTFTNAAEYAQYLAIAITIAWVYFLRAHVLLKPMVFLAMGVMAYALFLESSRTPILTVVLAMATVSVVSAKRRWQRWMVTCLAVLTISGLYVLLGHLSGSHNALIAHQVNGLTHPTNSHDSTAQAHLSMVFSGVTQGFTHPLGRGLGTTTLAAGKLGNSAAATNSEIDVSNLFISDGLFGGILYCLLIVRVFVLAFRAAMRTGTNGLIVLGVLVATLGQWSNGGDYASSAFVWLCIGFLDKIMETDARNQPTGRGARFPVVFRHGWR